MKKAIAWMLCLAMLCGMTSALAGEQKTVSLRVEGAAECLFYDPAVPLEEGDSVLSLLVRVLDREKISYQLEESAYGGYYFPALAGEAEYTFGGYDGWLYYVNGSDAPVSIDGYLPEGGEEIVVAYCDPYGDPATLLPICSVTREAGEWVLTVTAETTVYDENWNPTVSLTPVSAVQVQVNGATLLTDEQGRATLPSELKAGDTVALSLEKYAENGKPLVLRTAPDFAVTLPGVSFPDVPEAAWFAPAVLRLTERGILTGMPDGSFAPSRTVTRGEIVTMLWRMAGEPQTEKSAPFADVDPDCWCGDAVCWAAEQQIALGYQGNFSPNAPITRQDLAVMLMRYQTAVVQSSLPQDAPAPAFADNAEIAPYAAESIYLLQKAGIVNGVSGSFLPRNTASRAEACKMLGALL